MRTLFFFGCRSLILAGILFFGVLGARGSDGDALEVRVEAFLVQKTGEGVEELIKVGEVKPGQIIEFILTYRNTAKWTMRNISVSAPVPRPGIYIEDSATARYDFMCSIDNGQVFKHEPVRYKKRQKDGSEVDAIASPGAYTHLHWRIDRLRPRATAVLRFRTLIR